MVIKRKKKGCLCIHGFTGSPYEVEPLAQYIQMHMDCKILVPTLPGHEQQGNLADVVYEEWIYCAEKSLKELIRECEEVYVIGFSMGGVIASYLASKYHIEKLVLLSAAAKYVCVKHS